MHRYSVAATIPVDRLYAIAGCYVLNNNCPWSMARVQAEGCNTKRIAGEFAMVFDTLGV
jgi:hypothetical protein